MAERQSARGAKRTFRSRFCGTPLSVVDLFSGAGGLSEGFRQAGFSILAGADNHVVGGSRSRRAASAPVVDGVLEHDSKDTPSIQLCDVLLGAAAAPWQQECSSEAKLELQKFIAGHLGWKDLHADTFTTERKWNTWVFFDPKRQQRRATSKVVTLKYPLPSKTRAA